MGLFDWLFGRHRSPKGDYDNFAPLYGGDGLTEQTAVIVNCASMDMAKMLMNRFITERHGQHGTGWSTTNEFFINIPGVPTDTIRAICARLADGRNITYYFNLARPMAASIKLLKQLGVVPKDVD